MPLESGAVAPNPPLESHQPPDGHPPAGGTQQPPGDGPGHPPAAEAQQAAGDDSEHSPAAAAEIRDMMKIT